jgi:peroxiredoxin
MFRSSNGTPATVALTLHGIALQDLVADSGAVIFFYPRANTGGCTTQACGFRDNYDKLLTSGYKVPAVAIGTCLWSRSS